MTDKEQGRLRLDLYLKRSGLVKRRPLAATLCDNGYVTINGRPAAPGKSVKVGDRLQIRYARKMVLVEVMEIPGKQVKKGEGYKVLNEEIIEEELF
ncbi:MAG: RNA-binding S4 domain-containing protein [bacterium]|nr:RNA-binding S4 domain-containing protein [bacterium]MDT8365792.1 RNA-binding S4 domain-containing protein [bacterium]